MPAYQYLVPEPRAGRDHAPVDAFVARFRPLHDVLVVEVEPDEFVSQAGLIIGHANIEQNEVRMGRVLKTGPGVRGRHGGNIPCPFAVGDRVCFSRSDAYRKLSLGGYEVRLMKQEQVEHVVFAGDDRIDVSYPN